jgi:uncharacterized protein YlzI (FlbEa/FlbD family)
MSAHQSWLVLLLASEVLIQLTLPTGEKVWLNRSQISVIARERQGEAQKSVPCPGQCTIIRYGSQGRMIVQESVEEILEKIKE